MWACSMCVWSLCVEDVSLQYVCVELVCGGCELAVCVCGACVWRMWACSEMNTYLGRGEVEMLFAYGGELIACSLLVAVSWLNALCLWRWIDSMLFAYGDELVECSLPMATSWLNALCLWRWVGWMLVAVRCVNLWAFSFSEQNNWRCEQFKMWAWVKMWTVENVSLRWNCERLKLWACSKLIKCSLLVVVMQVKININRGMNMSWERAMLMMVGKKSSLTVAMSLGGSGSDCGGVVIWKYHRAAAVSWGGSAALIVVLWWSERVNFIDAPS